jgi:hypothetical protein
MVKNVEMLVMKAKPLWMMLLMCAATMAIAIDSVEHKYAENNGVKFHYAAMGMVR